MLPILILAGGLGTRLGSVPKSLVDINGKPFLYHQIKLLSDEGFDEFILCLGHFQDQILKELKNPLFERYSIKYTLDNQQYGTGGAIRQSMPWSNENFFVIYGDSYLETNYEDIQYKFLSDNKLGLMTVYDNHDYDKNCNVLYEYGKIQAYAKNSDKTQMHHIDYGISIFNEESFGYISEKSFDLSLVHKKLIMKGDLGSYEVFNKFYEIGNPESLESFREYAKEKEL